MADPTLFPTRDADSEEHWISVSDLMSGLMIIFLFIAITYIRPVLNERDTVREIAITWQESETRLHEALRAEFAKDLPRWNAELDKATLSIRFNAPEVLFAQGQAELRPDFRAILADFFPRYLQVLSHFPGMIEEIRIEGHTSTAWGALGGFPAYFRNMALSQERTRAVLEFCFGLPRVAEHLGWALPTVTANGLSSSRPVLAQGVEDVERSRRVEFRVRTRAREEIVRILEAVR